MLHFKITAVVFLVCNTFKIYIYATYGMITKYVLSWNIFIASTIITWCITTEIFFENEHTWYIFQDSPSQEHATDNTKCGTWKVICWFRPWTIRFRAHYVFLLKDTYSLWFRSVLPLITKTFQFLNTISADDETTEAHFIYTHSMRI